MIFALRPSLSRTLLALSLPPPHVVSSLSGISVCKPLELSRPFPRGPPQDTLVSYKSTATRQFLVLLPSSLRGHQGAHNPKNIRRYLRDMSTQQPARQIYTGSCTTPQPA
ncbi:hypothetical protein DFH07DRAFT_776939 [Mycena maculata]|uniref:Uncharacterized protein n=1 Tax=Mycena maculata TaxID=230809 RepID=A0AAD7IK64_9AGAR|nr:hypothetical protein DFH07DRAFT_776939 [Mycena maculata]